MTKKTTIAAILAAASMTMAAAAYAVTTAPVATPAAPVEAAAQIQPKVGMQDAVAAAEKAYDAKSFRANLRQTAQYGLVWNVCMEKKDGTHVRAYVDAMTGKVVAANTTQIRGRGMGQGMGPGMNPNCPMGGPGMGMNPDCPMVQGQGMGRHHRGPGMGMHRGFHHNW